MPALPLTRRWHQAALAALLSALLPMTAAPAAEWTFATPEPGAGCTVAPGPFASGWLWDLLPGAARGYWDLGRTGTVTATLTADAPFDLVTVQSVEWQDGALYATPCAVTLPGELERVEVDLVESSPAFGGWLRYTSTWRLPAPTNTLTVCLTSPHNGAVVDRLTLTPGPAAPLPLKLWVEVSAGPGLPWQAIEIPPVQITNAAPSALFRLRIGR